MANSISTMSQQLGLINRVKEMQIKMAGFQEQVATGVKYQTFSEYGSDAQRIQEYRTDLSKISVYVDNIDQAQINIEQMTNAISETSAQAGNVLSAISIQLEKGSGFDLESIKSAANSALQIVQANINARVGDRYLFTGTDVSNAPYDGASVATSNFQTRISDWLAGTSDTTTFLTGLDNLTDSQLGYSTTVQTAKNVFVRADDSFEVDYTTMANDEGFRKILTGLTALANMQKPTTGDVATSDDFFDAIDSMYATVQEGVSGLRAASTNTASAAQTLEVVKQNHLNDRQNHQKTLEKTEATDISDSIVKLQSLQTQLEASFRITSTLSQLSLARILG